MLLLLALFSFGALMLSAGLILLPYRIRFLRPLDRMAFMVSTLFSSAVGALLVGSSGAFLCLSVIGG